MVGLALSGYMTPIVAMGLLVAFLLLAIETYLATYTVGKFHLSFFQPGDRTGNSHSSTVAIGNVALYVRGPWSHLAGRKFLLFDVGAVVAVIGMGTMFLYAAIKHTVQLYREERLS